MREIVVVMGNNFPNMFQDHGTKGKFDILYAACLYQFKNSDEKLGYGLGGSQGLKQLPEHMVDRVRNLIFPPPIKFSPYIVCASKLDFPLAGILDFTGQVIA